jgi:AbrB family looped-hinge helix DNA binding protein
MAEATLSAQNRIVLPKNVREALDLKPGGGMIVAIRIKRTRKHARSKKIAGRNER